MIMAAVSGAACDARPDRLAAADPRTLARPLVGADVPRQLYETGLGAETTFVVRDSAAWSVTWRHIDNDSPPSVDFANEMLLVASPGMGTWGRDVAIRVTAVRRDSLIATVHERVNIPGLCILDGGRSPADVVRVPRDDRPVAFRWEVEEMTCLQR